MKHAHPYPSKNTDQNWNKKTSLLNDRVTAENEVMAAEQFITLLSVLGESPQIKSLEEIALYNRRLIAEIVSLTCIVTCMKSMQNYRTSEYKYWKKI